MSDFSKTWTTENINNLLSEIKFGSDNIDLSCFEERNISDTGFIVL